MNFDILTYIFFATGLFDLAMVLRRDLMMLQQNSYRNDRYTRWFNDHNESTSLGRIFCCIGLMFMLIYRIPFFAAAFLSTIITLWQALALLKEGKSYKKPLVWTARARRIYSVMAILSLAISGCPYLLWGAETAAKVIMLLLILSPIVTLASNWLLKPVEQSINRKYYNEAANILRSIPDLKVIGITGSYGKTSTKHYLNRILEEHFSVCMTPGSFNTTMGVIRTVREHLKPYNQIFIVEMGAKQPGDIKEICDLVHPTAGIITAVGEQHLESFKTIENIQKTKFELADAIPADGFVVLNYDFPFVASGKVKNAEVISYSVNDKADFIATDIEYTPQGTTFAISGKTLEEPLKISTRLVGECNVSNLIAAIIVALKLGVPASKITYAVGQIEQVEHRLNMKRTPGGITIIDDAFNSNPTGSKMALDVLSRIQGGKRIIITPGMIELGQRQFEANKEFGRHIAESADVAIIVGTYNRQAIADGIAEADNRHLELHTVDTFTEAQALLGSICHPGDTVLYENDLPDTFK